jgi:hypothetical protein
MDDLLARAREKQQSGHALLESLGLIEMWRQVGFPAVIGSLRTGLMVDNDIDLIVHVDRAEPASCFGVLRALAVKEALVEIIFFQNKLRSPFPSLFCEAGCTFRGEDWSVQTSVVGATCPQARYPEELAEGLLKILTEDQRRLILAIKEERMQRFGPAHLSRPGRIPSTDLYRAVFDGRAKTYDECAAWIARNQREGVYRWLPSAV